MCVISLYCQSLFINIVKLCLDGLDNVSPVWSRHSGLAQGETKHWSSDNCKIHIVTTGSPQCALEQPLEMWGIWLYSELSLFDDSEGFNQWSRLLSMSFPVPPVKQCAPSQVSLYLFIFNIYLLSIINGLINQTILQWKKRMDLYYTFAYLWQSPASPIRGQ